MWHGCSSGLYLNFARELPGAHNMPWSCEKMELSNPDNSRLRIHSPKTRAERAFHLGGAGAPARAFYRKDPILNFFTAPLPGGGEGLRSLHRSDGGRGAPGWVLSGRHPPRTLRLLPLPGGDLVRRSVSQNHSDRGPWARLLSAQWFVTSHS